MDDEIQEVTALRALLPPLADISTMDEIKAVRATARALVRAANAMVYDVDQRGREIQASLAKPHPWVGKNVKRTVEQRLHHSMWDRSPPKYRTKVERGKVVQMGAERRGYRNYSPSPGESFVESKTGTTAYSLNDRAAWELDE